MYLSKIDEYEKLKPIVPDISDRAKELKQFYPMKLRAQAYLTMATFQKDGYKRAELNEQSMKIFNKILEDDFKEEMLQQYEQNDATKHMLTFYSHINIQNSKNYDNVIGVKVDYLLNLPTDAEETKLRLKELNILRRDYAVQMLTFEKFVKRNPEEYPRNNLVRLYVDIATQFRSIVLINQMNKNMEQSFAFLLLAAGVWKELDPSCTENQTLKEVAGSFGYQINQHPFIKKFC